ncbi:MAG: nucleotidyltransferase family protein [Candidatus Omnitrophica bacterium]|nr:nucleotidyltransferase family protein [Candidatus Omnitrophota bacterium]
MKIKQEDIFLRYCAKRRLDDAGEKIKEILSPDLNWAYFLEKARINLLLPIVYKSLLKFSELNGLIPFQIQESLKSSYYSTYSRNIFCTAQLKNIISNFEAENIPTIIFKGIMLAELIYGDIGLRGCADIDLLVRKDDLLKVNKVLRQLGYTSTYSDGYFKELCFSYYCDSFLYFNQDKNKIPVDIHVHLSNNRHLPHTLDMEDIWQKAQPIDLRGISLYTFSQEHLLIYLAMHAVNHCFYPLILLCDINELLLRYMSGGFAWDNLMKEAEKTGLYKQLYYALFLSSQILDTPLPEGLLQNLTPRKISIFEKRFLSTVLRAKSVFTGEGWVYLGMRDNLKERLMFLYHAIKGRFGNLSCW